MGCCGCSGATWITIIMVYTIIQSIIHLAWQVIQIMLHACSLDVFGDSEFFSSNIYGIYYYNPKCIKIPITNEKAQRVNYITMTHLAFDIFWILMSIVVLFNRCSKSQKKSPYCTYIFWICVASVQIVLDGTSTVYFAIDTVLLEKREEDAKSAIIIMAIISSRFGVLLLINIWMFIGMIIITRKFGNHPPPKIMQPRPYPHLQPRQQQQQYHPERQPYRSEQQPYRPEQQLYRPEQQPYRTEQQPYHPQQQPYHPQQQPFQPQQRIVPLKPIKPAIKKPKVPYLEEQNMPRVNNWYNHYTGSQQPNISSVPNDGRKGEEQNIEHHQSWCKDNDGMEIAVLPRVKADGRPREEEEDKEYNRRKIPPPENYEETPSETSYSEHPNFVGDHTNVMVNGVPSGTLRRQLPWSYVHQPGMFPRKQYRAGPEELPPIPVPDYSMRFARNQRLDLDAWSQNSTSPGPSAKYDNRNAQSQQFY